MRQIEAVSTRRPLLIKPNFMATEYTISTEQGDINATPLRQQYMDTLDELLQSPCHRGRDRPAGGSSGIYPTALYQ